MKRRGMKKAIAGTAAAMMICAQTTPALAADLGDTLNDFHRLLTFTAKVEGEDLDDLKQLLDNSFLTLGLEGTEDKGVFNLDLEVLNQSLFKVLASCDEKKIAVSFPDADTNMYTYAVEKLMESATTDGENPLQLHIQQGPDIPLEDYTAVAEEYFETVGDFVMNHMAADSPETYELTHLGQELTGDVVSFTATGTEVADLMNAYADQIEKDSKLDEISEKWADYYQEMIDTLPEDGILDENANPENIEALRNLNEEAAKELRKSAEEVAKNTDKMLDIKAGATDDQLHLMTMGIYMDGKESPVSIFYENLDGSLATGVSFGDEDFIFTSDYNHEGDIYSGSYKLAMGDYTLGEGSYNFDAGQKSNLDIPYGTVDVNALGVSAQVSVGDGANGTNDHTLTITGLSDLIPGTPSQISVNMNSSEDVATEEPSGTEVDVTDYTQEELNKLGEEIGEKLQAHLNEVFGS